MERSFNTFFLPLVGPKHHPLSIFFIDPLHFFLIFVSTRADEVSFYNFFNILLAEIDHGFRGSKGSIPQLRLDILNLLKNSILLLFFNFAPELFCVFEERGQFGIYSSFFEPSFLLLPGLAIPDTLIFLHLVQNFLQAEVMRVPSLIGVLSFVSEGSR